MRFLLSFFLVVTPSLAFSNTYEGTRYETTTGKVYQHWSGELDIAASTASWSTYTITLNGTGGKITATTIDVSSITVSTMTVSSLTATALTTPSLAATTLTSNLASLSTGSVSNLAILNSYTEARSSDSIGTATTFNVAWSSSPIYSLTITTSTTLTFSGAKTGQTMTFILSQDAQGGRTVTWPTIDWGDYGTPVISTGAYKTTFCPVHYNGTKYWGLPCSKGYNP